MAEYISSNKKSIIYLLACNFGEVIYVIVSLLTHLPIITPLQILYINIVTDGLPAISLAFAPDNPEIMREKPREGRNILGRKDFRYIFLVGTLTAVIASLSVMPVISSENQTIAGTILFTALIIMQQLILLDIWIGKNPLLKSGKLLKHPIFLSAFFLPFILHPALLYLPLLNKVFDTIPLTIGQITLATTISLLITIILEYLKIIKKQQTKHEEKI